MSIYHDSINNIARYLLSSFNLDRLCDSRILVAGASGMIGKPLVDTLMELSCSCQNLSVTAMGRNENRLREAFKGHLGKEGFSLLVHDVNSPLAESGRFDYMIHAASNTHPLQYSTDPVGTIMANTVGTMNLLEYARRHSARRFVFLSSVEIYGEARPDQAAFSEGDLGYIDCNTVRAGYPEGKRCGESLCCAYARQYGLDFVAPRLCRVYGPTMRSGDSKALSQFIRKAASGEDIVLKSSGSQFYSYIDVFDAVSAIIAVMLEGKSGGAYNVSSARQNVTLRELAQKLASLAGTKVVFEIPDDTERVGYSTATRAVLDGRKLLGLGWKELYGIDDGLKLTLDILREDD
ncbi:MAG: NAD-dependent epimerase/dehydratase family protein [Treponema sp.]|nr:NAD-dependent epimerase/dehydratase family protein [Treponema sp.]